MKRFLKITANLKMLGLIVFAGMLILFLMGKAIFYQEFVIETLDIVWLTIMAIVVSLLKAGADYKADRWGFNKKFVVISLGVLIVGLMFLANWIFGLFALQGIQYLYFGLIMTGLYIGACFGFWVVGKLEIDSLNACLTAFKKQV